MRIFIGESDSGSGRRFTPPSWRCSARRDWRAPPCSGTSRGSARNWIPHTAGLLKLSANLALIIEVVDSQKHVDAILPEVAKGSTMPSRRELRTACSMHS